MEKRVVEPVREIVNANEPVALRAGPLVPNVVEDPLEVKTGPCLAHELSIEWRALLVGEFRVAVVVKPWRRSP